MSSSVLETAFQLGAGAVALDIRFKLTKPWTVLFGASGCGKTTVLRAIGGFVRPTSGRIRLGTNTLFDADAGVDLPAHRRPIRSAGQFGRLFPHLTTSKNVLYGNGWHDKPQDAAGLCEDLMQSFGIWELRDRRPVQLSGGEAQRAAVARALLAALTCNEGQRPLLLLDEPFSALDTATRERTLHALRGWTERFNTPVLSVTHNLAEAFQLQAEVMRLEGGRIVDQGPAEKILAADRDRLLEQLGAAPGRSSS